MGRIKKAAGPKHEATVSPAIADFVTTASTLPISRLLGHLNSFPRRWPFPRGDLYHWIPLFNRFDNILEQFNIEYSLNAGPQVRPFGRVLLLKGVAEESKAATVTPTGESELDAMGFGSDGDRKMVEVILDFSRGLLENCGNRSLYNSSERLGDLLNTTNLSLLTTALQLAVRLAQRYHASRQRGANASQHLNNTLLASHYNIDLEKVQKLANSFTKLAASNHASATATIPTPKGKEKTQNPQAKSSTSIESNDLLALTQETKLSSNGSANRVASSERADTHTPNWEDWGEVLLTYYQSAVPKDDQKPTTPTPTRRPSALSRPSRLSSSDESPEASIVAATAKSEEPTAGGMKHVEIPYSRISSSTVEDILKDTVDNLPKDSRYDLLTKVRCAHAVTTSLSARQSIVGIRLLAITNLAYIYPEATFQQKILQQDSDEPRRLQIAYQLADLIHPPGNGASGVPPKLQTLALGTLEALAKQKIKAPDVCAALNINVNHGVLFYILRKAVVEMATEDSDEEDLDSEERREAVFSLLEALPASTPRTGETLIAAGLLDILIEILNLRTGKAERNHPKVLTFLNTFIYTVRDAFQVLANSKGLDTISDLIAYEVLSSLERANRGEGLPQAFRNRVIDYQIPYFQQQTMRMLFKIINHMMTHSTGNFDRLLRNLIDSPQLLSGLRTVIVNAKVFGSSVWSGAINIMSSFIHNEPTSYAVISEAGLSKGLLETINLKERPQDPMMVFLDHVGETDVFGPALTTANANRIANFMHDEGCKTKRQASYTSPQEILPATDAIVSVPQAFGAICLNHSGMEMFLKSGALDSFFKVFESDDHVKSMSTEIDLPRLLGSSFDELVRHHPNLKMPVMIAIMTMIERVGQQCKSQASGTGCGAKLWLQAEDGQLVPAGDGDGDGDSTSPKPVKEPKPEDENDVVMGEASPLNSEDTNAADLQPRLALAKAVADRDNDKKSPSTVTRIEVAMKFLSGFFENSSLCAFFVEASGAEYILDLATMPTLPYDYNVQPGSLELARVAHIMAEQKPHLVLPSILQRAQKVADNLEPLYNHVGEDGFFSEFIPSQRSRSAGQNPVSHVAIGTKVVKSLVEVHSLCTILREVFESPIFTSRSNHTPFSQTNLADMYRQIVKSFGFLHRVCVWEEILLQKELPESWKEATKSKGYGMGSDEADEIFGFRDRTEDAHETITNGTSTSNASGWPADNTSSSNGKKPRTTSMARDENSAQFKNVKTLRYLLSQVAAAIAIFSQNLGRSLVPKRRLEAYARQNAYMVAEALSETSIEQLSYEPPRKTASAKDRYSYWIVILTSISSLIHEGSMDGVPSQVLTLVLQAFKNDGGLDAIKEILQIFFEEVKSSSVSAGNMTDGAAVQTVAYGGIKIILGFYTQITMSKSIMESPQTNAITSNDRDRGHMHFFSPPQFLVELRMAILPVVKSIWDSDFVDKASGSIIKCLIDILRTILEGGEEQGAFKRGDQTPASRKTSFRIYGIHGDKVRFLTDQGFDRDVAQEALYRCLNAQNSALEYCQALKTFPGASRNPIPGYDRETPRRSVTETPQRSDSGATLPDPDNAGQPDENPNTEPPFRQIDSEMINAILNQAQPDNSTQPNDESPVPNANNAAANGQPDVRNSQDADAQVEVEEVDGVESGPRSLPPPPPAPDVLPEANADGMAMSIDNIQNLLSEIPSRPEVSNMRTRTSTRRWGELPTSGGPSPSGSNSNVPETSQSHESVTVNDLDDERTAVRENLIDRALEVLNVHDDVTFELADLINAAALKASEPKTMRREIGETLVQALISFQMEDDFRAAGKKIAAYANLLALVLQDRDFYEATLEELLGNFEQLLGFIKIFPDQPPDEVSPWIGQILLVVEKMLSEDVQPSQIQWAMPTDGKLPEEPAVSIDSPLVPTDEKFQLFEAIIEILPRIGKDESLALSVVRTLVILTRTRELASRLGEKRNIQRLFVMVKQLSGMTNDRLPPSFMLILRHIIEDDDTIRQIMRSEIMSRFETRSGRQTDTTGYVRQMYDLVIRSPQIFVEVTNEKLEISRYDSSQRPQVLSLKNEGKKPEEDMKAREAKSAEATATADSENASIGATEGQAAESQVAAEAKPSTNEEEKLVAQKPKAAEIKAPVVEHPSGVIHYLLYELLSYKDVEDKDPTTGPKEPTAENGTEAANADTTKDAPATSSSSAVPTTTPDSNDSKKPEKPEFKPDQHPIYVYRCFILQCLAELLHCYNRTKIEFINFSRKADPKAMTPSKPRSGVLNYLLNDVIPVGTLGHEETIAYRKKHTTSNWAMSAIVSLCLKKRGSMDESDELDLLFVRKFVLEHALKAYRDANASEEYPDVKYARLLDIADLFYRLLHGRLVPAVGTHPPEIQVGFQDSIAKLMFEKNFISALTASIADIDLNFPGAKRAIKYILRPLKQLTSTAVLLSEDSSISSMLGQTDDDEISTATSVSEIGDEREETPDLFRNSTLGMFEPGREEESSSDSSEGDVEMYEDEYDEGMDYEDGMDRDEDGVISDEDEELGEAGHMEGLPGDSGMDVEVVIDGDEDEPSEDDDGDQEDSEDMNDDEEVEVVDEITGDSENASLAEGEDEDWQDEDGEDIERYNEEGDLDHAFSSQDQDAESAVREIVREFGGAEAALQRLEGLEDGRSRLAMDIEEGRYMDDVVRRDDDDDEDDDEEGGDEDMDDEDVIFQPEYDDEEPGMWDPPGGWDPDDEPPRGHHHHHHHPRRMPDSWSLFPGASLDRGSHMPLYRSHRPSGVPHQADDGVNPLLQRNDRAPTTRNSRGSRFASMADAGAGDYWVHGMEPGGPPRGLSAVDSPVSFINNLLASVDQGGRLAFTATTGGGPNRAMHIQIGAGGPGGGQHSLPLELQVALGLPTRQQETPRLIRDERQQSPATFIPAVTSTRWQEEARLLFGNAYNEKAQRVVNSILRVLVPPALEKKKREEDELKRMREQALKLREEENAAREKAEKEEKEKREQEEREAAVAREAEEAEAAARNQEDSQEPGDTEDEGAMEGIESTQIGVSAALNAGGEAPASVEEPPVAGPSEAAERVRTTIRGRELDITGLGIDLAYLDALPEDIREEVLMSQLAIQRSQAAAAGEEPTDISREFLEALPPDIREELLQQEAQDRRRREREEARRRQQAAGGVPAARAEEMDPASFLASLDPTLRQHVLMEQDEEMLAHLPEEIAAEARALGGDRPMHRFAGIQGRAGRGGPGLVRHLIDNSTHPPRSSTKKPPRRQIVQMLDKAGVATLLRLMFVPQQGSSRQSLNGILHDVSQNRQNRAEVINLLLSILQDGSADVNAVERSFTHLSLRAKQPAAQKTPQPLKRALTGPMASVANNMEATPLMVIQQCLSALVSLTQYNPHIPYFFLNEHEVSSGMKTKSNRKGKGKETKASKFALNTLLSLLDRKLIMESSGCMEQLSSLLQSVTHPLTMLLRKEKEKSEESKAIEAPTTRPEGTTDPDAGTNEQPTQEATQLPEPSIAENTPAIPPVQADTRTDAQRDTCEQVLAEVQEDRQTRNEAAEAESKAEETKKPAEEEKAKKPRTLTPPVVPEENLRLVVNILAARECSAKTFRDTLSTINNLSGIPGAKEVFGKGLIEQAQALGQSILQDLDELVPQIKQAESSTDIQGMALTKFSPASSDQAKLLRVLTALDYLFDPKRNGGKTKPAVEDVAQAENLMPKEDLLTTLYENPTFGSLWNKLSECLSCIRHGDGMLNVATILLPLIEALMVVCKNTTLKDIPLIKAAKEFAITSPPPESAMESLFFRFTEDHRKILNDLVRHNPKLMSGTFSLLVKNPKVLEFDNKRNYFTRRLHSRGTEARHPQPPLQLSVRRDQVFLDSFKFLSFKTGDEIKYGKLSIRFSGEEGVDAGGVTREWFQVLSRQMFNPDYALFIPVASDRTTFHPNKLSKVNDEHLLFFKFIGRIIGKALYEGRALDCHFSRAVYKRILGKTVSIKDMETLDLDYYKSLIWMLHNDISDIITETFSVETDDFGVTEIVDLVENGRNIPVTEDNKQEYVQLVVEYRLTGSVQTQLEKFLQGFHDIVPPELISIFNEQELELLISGLPDIDVDDWKNHTEYHNYQASSPQIQWFWRAVRSFDKEEKAKLLQFVTGTSKVPLNGFGQLEGMNGFSRFNIHRDYGNKDRLPSSHTCFNQLDLPEYESYEALRQQVYTAMTAGSEYFGFA